jgi:hypothetical protein
MTVVPFGDIKFRILKVLADGYSYTFSDIMLRVAIENAPERSAAERQAIRQTMEQLIRDGTLLAIEELYPERHRYRAVNPLAFPNVNDVPDVGAIRGWLLQLGVPAHRVGDCAEKLIEVIQYYRADSE